METKQEVDILVERVRELEAELAAYKSKEVYRHERYNVAKALLLKSEGDMDPAKCFWLADKLVTLADE